MAPPEVAVAASMAPKKLSCIFCAQRKIRCDRLSPCGNCRKAGVPCVASIGKRRRAQAQSSPLDARLRTLEALLESLQAQLESARASPGSSSNASPPAQESTTTSLSHDIGRLVIQSPEDIRGLSSGFCSSIAEELLSIKQNAYEQLDAGADDYSDEDGQGIGQEVVKEAWPARSQGGFIFGHMADAGSLNIQDLRPMPSQIPFLLDVFTHRVQLFISIPHMPSVHKIPWNQSYQTAKVATESEDVLLSSLYYAAIVSLDEEEVTRSFATSKSELLARYRTGFELALAKADFLNKPDLTIVQALCVYLNVARRHENPRVGWMLVGLAVRMGHFLGLHQDGEGSDHLRPFDIEMRRRTWWALLALDLRSSEDQGTTLAIPPGSFTTKWPSNLDDSEISPDMPEFLPNQEAITNVTLHRIMCEVVGTVHQMLSGQQSTVDDQARRLNTLRSVVNHEFFRYPDAQHHSSYIPLTGLIHIVMGRLTIVGYFPIVVSSANAATTLQLRTTVLVAAIEVTEHNHGLNTDSLCRPWTWVYQCEVYWHAIVYLLIEICRRPWTSSIERAWSSLHSPFLVPARASIQDNLQIFVPLQKLIVRARRHRRREIARWQNDPIAAATAELEDQETIPIPRSSVTFPETFDTQQFRQRWLDLTMPSSTTSPESQTSSEHVPGQQVDSDHALGSGKAKVTTANDSWSGTPLRMGLPIETDVFPSPDIDLEKEVEGIDFGADFNWDQWIGAAQGMDWTL